MSQRLALVLALVAGVATSFVVSPGLSRRGVHGRPRRALADGASSRGAAVSAAGAAGQGEEHREYLTSVASVEAPARLEVLLEVLLASDPSLEPMAPTTRGGGVHPLVIPLAQNQTGHFGLLRAPTAARADPLPVVWCSAGHGGMTLQCTNSDNFVVGLAVEADHEEDAAAEALIETANKGLEYEEAYEMGSVRNFVSARTRTRTQTHTHSLSRIYACPMYSMARHTRRPTTNPTTTKPTTTIPTTARAAGSRAT